MISHGKMKLALAAPNADHPPPLRITSVHDAKRRMDKLLQKELIKFRHYPSHIRMVGEGLNTLENLRHPPCPHIGHPLLRVLDPLFFGFLVIADRLDHGDTPAPVREQHWPPLKQDFTFHKNVIPPR